MDNEAIDFSSLDPSRDVERWERMIDDVADRALAAHRRQLTIFAQVLRWSRPALAAAALVVLCVWTGAMVSSRLSTPAAARRDGVAVFVRWALGQRSASVWEAATYVGGEHGRR